MMYWNDGSVGWAGWIVMIVSMSAFWGLLAWVAVSLIRSTDRPQHKLAPEHPRGAARRAIRPRRDRRGGLPPSQRGAFSAVAWFTLSHDRSSHWSCRGCLFACVAGLGQP